MSRRIMAAVLCFTMAFSLAACDKTENETAAAEDNTITMAIALGNGEQYYNELIKGIKEDLGIEVKPVYQISSDTSTFLRLNFQHNDMPADIVFTASKTPDEYLEGCCLDLLSETHLTSHFTYNKTAECTAESGAVYQLPLTSKLIGITYNETLLNELGCEIPKTFEDMVNLKAICDEKGIPFAVCDGVVTGHGFNWLFHLMGSQWLSTTEGTEWFNQFKKGEASVDEFKEKCEYFKKWKEAGLFGTFQNQDWLGAEKFETTRAMFWYGITNSVSSYDGTEEGTGKEIHDVYKTIPWISEDGTNNCFTVYDNSWVAVKKELGDKGNEKKLENVIKVIDYMTSEKVIKLAADISKDVYVAVNSFTVGDDRLYSAFSEDIKNGFIQPWYYNYFKNDAIVNTGEAVNAYIAGSGSFDDIFTILEETNQAELNDASEILFTAEETLSYEGTARIIAVSGALALQKSLDENHQSETVRVSLVPYTENPNELPPWRGACVVNTFVYQGAFESTAFNTIIPPNAASPCGIYMTGKQIKDLCNQKFDPSSRFTDAETGKAPLTAKTTARIPTSAL